MNIPNLLECAAHCGVPPCSIVLPCGALWRWQQLNCWGVITSQQTGLHSYSSTFSLGYQWDSLVTMGPTSLHGMGAWLWTYPCVDAQSKELSVVSTVKLQLLILANATWGGGGGGKFCLLSMLPWWLNNQFGDWERCCH